jgi:hypothetical protein
MKAINNNVILKKVKQNQTTSRIIMNEFQQNIGEVVFYDETLSNIKKGNIVYYNPSKIFHLNYKGKIAICQIKACVIKNTGKLFTTNIKLSIEKFQNFPPSVEKK